MHSSAVCRGRYKSQYKKLPTYMPINNKKGFVLILFGTSIFTYTLIKIIYVGITAL